MLDIEDIYDAALDRDRFEPLLRRIVAGMGAQAAFLAWVDMDSQATFDVQVGNDPAYLQSYAETYAEHDILRPTLQAAGEGVIMHAFEDLQSEAVRQSRFYREWLAPQGVVDNLAVNLIKRDQMFATMAVLRLGEVQPFQPADVDRLSSIVPHLRRAVYMQSRLAHQGNLVGAYQRIASGGRNGVILFDERLKVVDVDVGTTALTGLRSDQVLGATAFERALEDAVRTGEPVAVELRRGEPDAMMLLCVAQPLERNGFGDLAASAEVVVHAVHVLRVDRPANIAFESLARHYGLTPTEARVMADALGNADLTALGDRLGMARATARTHLHRIYDKTGVQGFAGLMLLAHRFALPTG